MEYERPYFLDPRKYFSTEFPTTPEEFDRVEVLSNTVVRIDLVRWLNAMFKKFPYENNQAEKEKFTYYTTTMTSSHERVNYLYKIQATHNLRAKVSINVRPGNEYYDILLKAHQLWLDLTLQFVEIFMQTLVTDNSRYFWALPNSSGTNPSQDNKGRQIMSQIIRNELIYGIIKQMEDNLKIVVSYIEEYEASENVKREED